MAAPMDMQGEVMDPFKIEYKRYKRRNPPPDLSEIIDFDKPGNFSDKIEAYNLDSTCCQDELVLNKFGLKPVKEWKVYRLKESPGFIFIVNPFIPGYQRYWVKRSLKDFPEKPNMRNLDLYMEVAESDNIWESRIHKRDPSLYSTDPPENTDFLSKLRWVTLGYHYNWGKKEYYGKEIWSSLPSDIGALTKCLASVLGFRQYHAQAGIVNYYNMSSTLGGHVDEAEFDMSAPLLSFSFGQTAIYLQGGKTRDVKPDAVFLKSGDVMIMSGETRWCYHSVPRILPPAKGKPVPECFKFTEEASGKYECDQRTGETTVEERPPEHHCVENESTQMNTSSANIDPKHSSSTHTQVGDSNLQFQNKTSHRTSTQSDDQSQTTTNSQCYDLDSVFKQFDEDMKYLKDEDNWKPFADYLHETRINFNVRQVMKPGQSFPEEIAKPGT
ncbi:nucleic acid dioxygenase ALKBH1-like [Ptychodera flava]|uniref:nucleic acid dioxygenase ALKBH1-like n=1 Tax=Ptychodera flava TaxID=63121 RepID=UPI00396A5F58